MIIPEINVWPLIHWIQKEKNFNSEALPLPPPPQDHVIAVCHEIGRALENVGFFNAVGTGLTKSEMAQLQDASETFFALSLEEKNQISASKSPCFRGYSVVGSEVTNGVKDHKEGIDLGTEISPPFPFCSSNGTHDDDGKWTVVGRNQWPSRPEDLRSCAERYMKRCTVLGDAVLRAIAIYLELDHDYFSSRWLDEPCHLMRILRYPPSSNDSVVQGIGEHTDFGALAILFQTQEGLEARTVDNEWVAVPVVDNALVVNIGDCLEAWTSGRIRATPHRVLRSPNAPERFSFPFFFEPSFEAYIEPIKKIKPRPGYTFAEGMKQFRYGDHIVKAFQRSYPYHENNKS